MWQKPLNPDSVMFSRFITISCTRPSTQDCQVSPDEKFRNLARMTGCQAGELNVSGEKIWNMILKEDALN